MDPIMLPEDLSSVSDEQLGELRTSISTRGAELRTQAEADLNDDVLVAIEELAAQADAVNTEFTARETAAAERSDRVAAAMASLAATQTETFTEEEAPEADADVEVEDAPEAEVEAPVVEAEVEEAPEAEVEAAPVAEIEADPAPIAEVTEAEAPAQEAPVADAPAAPAASLSPDDIASIAASAALAVLDARPAEHVPASATSLVSRRPGSVAPAAGTEGATGAAAFTLSGHVNEIPGQAEGAAVQDLGHLAEVMTQKRLRMKNVPEGVREFVSIASTQKPITNSVQTDGQGNLGVFNELQRQHMELVNAGMPTEALVASGACCTVPTPIYDFFRLAEPDSSFEGTIPVVEAPRGAIQFLTCTNWCDTAGAVGSWTCTDNEDPDYEKPCLHVDCPTWDTAELEAITQCVSFDNLQSRVFPELTENFLADVAVMFSHAKEKFFQDFISTNSTKVTYTSTYGFSRGFFEGIVRAAMQYRLRNAMSRTAPLLVYAPSWVLEASAVDIVNDASSGIDMLGSARRRIVDGLREADVTVVWYRDFGDCAVADRSPNAIAQAAGALNPWDSTARVYMMAPGTFARLDGGTLDLGIVRDSTLNKKNDFQMFMEEWLGMAMLGCESVELEMTLCPNGAAPLGVAAQTCP